MPGVPTVPTLPTITEAKVDDNGDKKKVIFNYITLVAMVIVNSIVLGSNPYVSKKLNVGL